MSNCCLFSDCEVQPRTREKPHCPECGRKGKSVGRQTIEHLLQEPLVAEIGEDDYYFCASRGCETVYYADSSQKVFHKSDLKVRVGIKEMSVLSRQRDTS